MALREIVGSVVTVFLVVYMLWFVIPVSRTAYTNEIAHVNQSSVIMQQLLPITNNWWVIFPLLIVVIGGYTVYSYATRNMGFDY